MTKATHTYYCMLLKNVAEIVLENLEKKKCIKVTTLTVTTLTVRCNFQKVARSRF